MTQACWGVEFVDGLAASGTTPAGVCHGRAITKRSLLATLVQSLPARSAPIHAESGPKAPAQGGQQNEHRDRRRTAGVTDTNERTATAGETARILSNRLELIRGDAVIRQDVLLDRSGRPDVLMEDDMQIKNRYTGEVLKEVNAADLCEADLRGADLCGAALRDAALRGANLCEADLRGADLRDADLRGANLCGADLCTANLCNADLCEAAMRDANLCEAALRGANLRDANLRDANLCGANLCDANLRDANLRDADLRDANLCGAALCEADLRGANLRDANLRGANLCGAALCEADLRGANLCGEKLISTPVFIYGLPWPVTVTNEFLIIGCQRHKHGEWTEFGDEKIMAMHPRALEFWNQWKGVLLSAFAVQSAMN